VRAVEEGKSKGGGGYSGDSSKRKKKEALGVVGEKEDVQ